LQLTNFTRFMAFIQKQSLLTGEWDSAANNEYSIEKGIYAYLQARDFGNRELVKTEKGKCFRAVHVPHRNNNTSNRNNCVSCG
jgi:hypothetical protein